MMEKFDVRLMEIVSKFDSTSLKLPEFPAITNKIEKIRMNFDNMHPFKIYFEDMK